MGWKRLSKIVAKQDNLFKWPEWPKTFLQIMNFQLWVRWRVVLLTRCPVSSWPLQIRVDVRVDYLLYQPSRSSNWCFMGFTADFWIDEEIHQKVPFLPTLLIYLANHPQMIIRYFDCISIFLLANDLSSKLTHFLLPDRFRLMCTSRIC